MWGLFHKPWHKDPYQTTRWLMECEPTDREFPTKTTRSGAQRVGDFRATARSVAGVAMEAPSPALFLGWQVVCVGRCEGDEIWHFFFFFWILRVRVHYIRFFNRTNSMVLIRLQLSWCVGFFEKKRGVSFSPKRTMDLCGMIEIHIRSLHWYSIFGVDSKNNLWTNKESRLMAPRLTGNTVCLGGFAAANLKLKVN